MPEKSAEYFVVEGYGGRVAMIKCLELYQNCLKTPKSGLKQSGGQQECRCLGPACITVCRRLMA